jgi:ADP-ribose pyrophosphatase
MNLMEVVFKGRVFSVEIGDQRFPDGSTHEVEVIRHPPSVVLIPIESDGGVLMAGQYRAPLARKTWEVPAGSVNEGESFDAAARREC